MTTSESSTAAGNSEFYIVALGSSAGGLEALISFFEAMPSDSGLAFVVIQHLAPQFKSQMADLLGRHTGMPAVEVQDGMQVEPNHIFLIPSGKCLEIRQEKLFLSEFSSGAGPRLPIDHFLFSLAADQGNCAIAIGLSGTGSDGTRGIRRIKEAGGMVMVQDEESARFGGMPGSIIATGLADFVLPAAEMPSALLKFVGHPMARLSKPVRLQVDDVTLQKIAAIVRTQSGIDFTAYKQSTVLRRIERRMGIAQIEAVDDYLALLEQSDEEITSLAQDLLIGVTRFFRDWEAFTVLRDKVLPNLVEDAANSRRIRVWVPACATGEEAYSIAILLQEQIAAQRFRCEMKIFATDVDKRAVDFASAGLSPPSITADIPPHLLAKYFLPENGGFRISRSIRNQVVFARQNLLQDPPFVKMDLISCRNFLIYLQPEWQQKVLTSFSFALRPKGFLFLGLSETLGDRQDAFDAVDAQARLFTKRPDASAAALEAINLLTPASVSSSRKSGQSGPTSPAPSEMTNKVQERIWEQVGALLFDRHVPTCIVLNPQHQIVHSYGHPERLLMLPAGEPTLHLMELLPEALSLAVSHSIRRAEKAQSPSVYPGVEFELSGVRMRVNVKVEPLGRGTSESAFLLVSFEELQSVPESTHVVDEGSVVLSNEPSQHIADLESDLRELKGELEAAIHEKDLANEELQAVNEEMLAANEELQSSNEELESVNEELTTLNAEFQQKITQLTVANNDLENFLQTSDLSVIFLDADLRIRRFTPAVTREISLLPHDVGRLLADFRHPAIEAIASDLGQLAGGGGTPVMKRIETSPGRWHLIKAVPYRRSGASNQGLVITLLDVTALQKSEK